MLVLLASLGGSKFLIGISEFEAVDPANPTRHGGTMPCKPTISNVSIIVRKCFLKRAVAAFSYHNHLLLN